MRNSFGSIALAALVAFVSCNKETSPTIQSRDYVIGIESSDEEKTTLSGSSVNWTEGDLVSAVCYSSRLGLYDVQKELPVSDISGRRATVKLSTLADYSPAFLLYPGDGSMGWDSATSSITAEIPTGQEPVKDGFPASSNLSFGKIGTGGTVTMKNALALIKFTIESSDIVSVTFSGNDGEKVSGKITFNPETMAVTSVSGTEKQTLSVKEGCFEPGTYYLPVIPQSFGKGISLKLVKNNGDSGKKTSSEAYTVLRNKVIDLGTESEWGIEYINSTKKISVIMSDGSTAAWAFTKSIPKKADIEAAAGAPMGPFVLNGNPDYEFYLRIQTYVQAESCRITGGAGFRFGGTTHDYMLLPAIPGFALVSVAITCGSQATTVAITDNPSSGDPTVVAGGEKKTIAKTTSGEFVLSGTKPGIAYRIDIPEDKIFTGILNFVLTYEFI